METQHLKQLFWDIDEKDLSSLKEGVVIARTLSYGTFGQVQALFSSYDKESIQAVFQSLREGALSERRRDYFALILA